MASDLSLSATENSVDDYAEVTAPLNYFKDFVCGSCEALPGV